MLNYPQQVFLMWVVPWMFQSVVLEANTLGLTGPAGAGSAEYIWLTKLDEYDSPQANDPTPLPSQGVQYGMKGMVGAVPRKATSFDEWKTAKMSSHTFYSLTPGFAYDSVYALAESITSLITAGSWPPADGDVQLRESFVADLQNTNMLGVTGPVNISEGMRYMVYDILSFDGSSIIVGNWTPAQLLATSASTPYGSLQVT